jgi:hypothetical protein
MSYAVASTVACRIFITPYDPGVPAGGTAESGGLCARCTASVEIAAVVLSSLAGTVADSALFLWLAFGWLELSSPGRTTERRGWSRWQQDDLDGVPRYFWPKYLAPKRKLEAGE